MEEFEFLVMKLKMFYQQNTNKEGNQYEKKNSMYINGC